MREVREVKTIAARGVCTGVRIKNKILLIPSTSEECQVFYHQLHAEGCKDARNAETLGYRRLERPTCDPGEDSIAVLCN